VNFSVTKSQLFWLFVAVFALRLAVGFHFFMEGTSKLQSPSKFTAAPFLNGARGPLAPMFRSLLDDSDGRKILCVSATSPNGKVEIDPSLTLQLWEDFADRAYEYYQLGDQTLANAISTRIKSNQKLVDDARNSANSNVDLSGLEEQIKNDKKSVAAIKNQLERLEEVLAKYKDELLAWIDNNRLELVAHFSTSDRELGFARDGDAKTKIVYEVDSLRQQTDTISKDRYRKTQGWIREVAAIWDALENEVYNLAVDRPATQVPLKIHRPFDQPTSKLKMINQFIPWFDVTVGLLLLIGLFTRVAAVAGGTFLASVIATQPPWVSGAKPVYYESVEMFALFLLAAIAAGRYGGLDYFIRWPRKSRDTKTTQDSNS
jgi:uncharacterized membrane protein YphA (DoxX/SURF4 family)